MSSPTELAAAPRLSAMRRVVGGLAGAVSFLTIAPVPRSWTEPGLADLSNTVAWLPLVGAALGGLAGGVRLVAVPILGPGPSTVLAMAVLVVASGALHQDALADFADGLGLRGDRSRRLAAMRDSSLGAFGTLALIGWALLLFTAIEPMSRDHGLLALVVAGATGLLAAVIHAVVTPPARTDGLGAHFRVGRGATAVAALISIAVSVGLLGPARGALAVGISLLVAVATASCARRALGGHTGDTLGAAVALTEAAVCLGLLASWR